MDSINLRFTTIQIAKPQRAGFDIRVVLFSVRGVSLQWNSFYFSDNAQPALPLHWRPF